MPMEGPRVLPTLLLLLLLAACGVHAHDAADHGRAPAHAPAHAHPAHAHAVPTTHAELHALIAEDSEFTHGVLTWLAREGAMAEMRMIGAEAGVCPSSGTHVNGTGEASAETALLGGFAAGVDCEWRIEPFRASHGVCGTCVRATFHDVLLGASDVLHVSDVPFTTWHGDTPPPTAATAVITPTSPAPGLFLATHPALYVRLRGGNHGDASRAGGAVAHAVRFSWATGVCVEDDAITFSCTGTRVLTARVGTFESNAAGTLYDAFAQCTWLIAPTDIAPGECITLVFSRLSVEFGYDDVSVVDGADMYAMDAVLLPSGGALTATHVNQPIFSSGGELSVWFQSDYSFEMEGFTATYEVAPCGAGDLCAAFSSCDMCVEKPSCSWCSGDAEDHTQGSCRHAAAACPGDSLGRVARMDMCPRYPREEALFVYELSHHLESWDAFIMSSWHPPERFVPRYTWCEGQARMLLGLECRADSSERHLLSVTLISHFGRYRHGPVPASLAALPHLRTLRVRAAQFNALPENIGALNRTLTTLVLQDTALHHVPESLGELTRLESLQFLKNAYPINMPDVRGLASLVEFIVDETSFRDYALTWDTFSGMASLERFVWRGVPGAFTLNSTMMRVHNPRLTDIELYSSRVALDVVELFRMPRVVRVFAQDSRVWGDLSQVDSSCIAPLRRVSFDGSDVHGTLDGMMRFPDLESLTLSRTRVTGTVPAALWAMPNIVNFNIDETAVGGELVPPAGGPVPWAHCNVLQMRHTALRGHVPAWLGTQCPDGLIDLSHNYFDGVDDAFFACDASRLEMKRTFGTGAHVVLPDTIGGFRGAVLDVSAVFVGTLPAAIVNATNLLTLLLSDNRLEGVVPVLPPLVKRVDLGHNKLTHMVDDVLMHVPGGQLSQFTVGHNRLASTEIPPWLRAVKRALTHDAVLDVSFNSLQGDLHQFLSDLEIGSIDMGFNPGLHGTLSPSWLGFSEMQAMVLPGCSLTGDAATIVKIAGRNTHTIDLAHNQITGHVPAIPTLTTLNLANNRLTGGLEALADMPDLVEIQLQGNMLDGALPDVGGGLGVVEHLELAPGNEALRNLTMAPVGLLRTATMSRDAQHGLPRIAQYSRNLLSIGDSVFSCYEIVAVNAELRLFTLNEQYTQYAACPCNVNTWGRAPHCVKCPDHANCPLDSVVPLAAADWYGEVVYVVDDGGDVVDVEVEFRECRLVEPGKTACVGREEAGEDPTDPNACADGYTDRLCAQCEDDHFEWGLKCKPCNAAVKTLFPFVLVLAIVAVYGVLFKAVSSRKGTLKILVFHLQMIALLSATGNPIPTLLLTTSEATSFANMSIPGVECYAPGVEIKEKFTAAFVMPFVLLGVSVLVYVCGVLLRRVSTAWRASAQSQGRVWLHLNVRVYMFLLVAYYISLSRWLLSVLPCEHGYMNAAPYVACGSSDHNTMVGMAVVGIVVYVIGFPAGVSWMLWRHRTQLHDVSRQRMWGFLYSSYVDDKWWWELVMIVRKLVIVCVIALSPYKSAALPVLVFLVLALSAMLQYRFQPFVSPTDNRLEIASLVIILLTYHLALTFFIPGVSSGTFAAVVVFLLNLGWVGAAVFVLTRRKLKGTASRLQMRLASPLLDVDHTQELSSAHAQGDRVSA